MLISGPGCVRLIGDLLNRGFTAFQKESDNCSILFEKSNATSVYIFWNQTIRHFRNEKKTGESSFSQRLLGLLLETGKKVANNSSTIPDAFAGQITTPVLVSKVAIGSFA